jgi:hypothetical protein
MCFATSGCMSQFAITYDGIPRNNDFIDSAFVILSKIQEGDLETIEGQWNSSKAERSELVALAILIKELSPTDTIYKEYEGKFPGFEKASQLPERVLKIRFDATIEGMKRTFWLTCKSQYYERILTMNFWMEEDFLMNSLDELFGN